MTTTAAEPKSTVPPIDKSGETKTAGILLGRFRRELEKSGLNAEWQEWTAKSLLAGLATRPE